MKTLERWCVLPRRALLVSILVLMSLHDVKMSRRDVIWCHAMTLRCLKWICTIYTGHTIKKSEIHFSTWRPGPLTYDLDLRTPLSGYQGYPSYRIITDRQNRHIDRTDFIPLTADAGGKNDRRSRRMQVHWEDNTPCLSNKLRQAIRLFFPFPAWTHNYIPWCSLTSPLIHSKTITGPALPELIFPWYNLKTLG